MKYRRRSKRHKPDRYERELSKVDKEAGMRGLHWFRSKDVPDKTGRGRRVRIKQSRCLRPKMAKRAKYPHQRFWASRTFTVSWVESYPSSVINMFKGWIDALVAPPAPEPGQLYPVAVDGLTPDTNKATVEWSMSYGNPNTLH